MTGVFIFVSAIELVVVHLLVPWEAIAKVRARRGRVGGKGNVVVEDGVLSIPVLRQTRVDVILQKPTDIAGAQITEVRLYADDAKGFVSAAQARIGTKALLTARDA